MTFRPDIRQASRGFVVHQRRVGEEGEMEARLRFRAEFRPVAPHERLAAGERNARRPGGLQLVEQPGELPQVQFGAPVASQAADVAVDAPQVAPIGDVDARFMRNTGSRVMAAHTGTVSAQDYFRNRPIDLALQIAQNRNLEQEVFACRGQWRRCVMTKPRVLYVPPQIEKRERLAEVAQTGTTTVVSGGAATSVKGGCFKEERKA